MRLTDVYIFGRDPTVAGFWGDVDDVLSDDCNYAYATGPYISQAALIMLLRGGSTYPDPVAKTASTPIFSSGPSLIAITLGLAV